LRDATVYVFDSFFKQLHNSNRENSVFACLIAAMLSVQCRDTTAISATKSLSRHLGGLTPDRLAVAPLEEVEQCIRSCNFYKTKARSITATAAVIMSTHSGAVPASFTELVTLPGVGPKIANLTLSVGHSVDHGFVVDTHVRRVCERIGLQVSGAEAVRSKLEELTDRSTWREAALALISFGQSICIPTNPRCHQCPLASAKLCAFAAAPTKRDVKAKEKHGRDVQAKEKKYHERNPDHALGDGKKQKRIAECLTQPTQVVDIEDLT
jgi:endonuclease-3